MASIRKRNGHYQITVSLGYDIYGKKLIETASFTRAASLKMDAGSLLRRFRNGGSLNMQ